MTCDICGGSKTVRLPIMWECSYSPTPVDLAAEMDAKPGWREYPCPECQGYGDVLTVTTHQGLLEREEAGKIRVARDLANVLRSDGLIEYETETPLPDGRVRVIGRLRLARRRSK